MLDEHFEVLERFWTDIEVHKDLLHGSVEAETVLVLPMNYGLGMRFPNDRNWYWQAGERAEKIWNLSVSLISEYGNGIDIIYDDPAFPIDSKYKRIYYWNESYVKWR